MSNFIDKWDLILFQRWVAERLDYFGGNWK